MILSLTITSTLADHLTVFGVLLALGDVCVDTAKDIIYATLAIGAVIVSVTVDGN